MRNLNEILNEGIFDKDLATNDTAIRAEYWADTFLRDSVQPYKHVKESSVDHIDHTSKKIFLKGIPWGVCVDATVKSFNGFFPEYDIVDKNGKEIDTVSFIGNIKNIDNIPSSFSKISFYSDADSKIGDDVWKGINKQIKSLKELYFVTYDYTNSEKEKWDGLDLSKLTTPVATLYIGPMKINSNIEFNTDQKVNTLQFGSRSIFNGGKITSNVVNLPVIKVLSFKEGDFYNICEFIRGIGDKGKSNFNNVNISCKDLTSQEKESIKQLLQGQELDSTMVGDILKKLDSINNNINDKDATKDRFGEKLSYGDIVLIADSANPQWPSMLDVYKEATSGGRIRTGYRSQLPPRNVIKLNNPKILELLK